MLRQIFTAAALLASGLAGATVAPGHETPAPSSAPPDGHVRVSDGLDPRDHVQSQLDWRSYFLNRLDGARHRVDRAVRGPIGREVSDEK